MSLTQVLEYFVLNPEYGFILDRISLANYIVLSWSVEGPLHHKSNTAYHWAGHIAPHSYEKPNMASISIR
jgi:hypothetical protein